MKNKVVLLITVFLVLSFSLALAGNTNRIGTAGASELLISGILTRANQKFWGVGAVTSQFATHRYALLIGLFDHVGRLAQVGVQVAGEKAQGGACAACSVGFPASDCLEYAVP